MKRIVRIVLPVILLVIVPASAGAQQVSQPKRVGLVLSTPTGGAPYLSAVRDGLRELGWIDGQNLVLEPRYYEGKLDRIAEITAELVGLRVDVIVTGGVPPTRAIKQATAITPIVVASATDPAATGLVTPGGNVAAFDVLPSDSAVRQLALLREVVPQLSRVALVWNGSNPASQLNSRRVREAAQAGGIDVVPVEVAGPAQLEAALINLHGQSVQAIFLVADPLFFSQRKRIGELTTASGLPTICQESDFADAGSLMSYGANVVHMFRQSASYVDRILRGAHPADLPIGPPTRFELLINVAAAKTIGLTIPQSVLGRADRLID